MGYTTNFKGSWKVTPALKPEHHVYLNAFSETRRMKRNPALTALRPDPLRIAAGLPVGVEGGYFVGSTEYAGQEHDAPDVLDYNTEPGGQPGLWCKWTPNKAGDAIEWSGMEKFYDYGEWLIYIIGHFLQPWGYKLSGVVEWQGEDHKDRGFLIVAGDDSHVYDLGKLISKQTHATNGGTPLGPEECVVLDAAISCGHVDSLENGEDGKSRLPFRHAEV